MEPALSKGEVCCLDILSLATQPCHKEAVFLRFDWRFIVVIVNADEYAWEKATILQNEIEAYFVAFHRARLLPTVNRSDALVLAPFYDIINQTSIDLQATKGNMLWKLEALHRSGQGETYNALAGGFEYTFVGIFDSAIDLGVLGEYHYDDRGESAATISLTLVFHWPPSSGR